MVANLQLELNPEDEGAVQHSEQDAIALLAGGRARNSAIIRARNFMAMYPTIVSVVILLLSVAAFGLIVGSRFFTPFNFSLIVQQVTVISVLGAAQTLVILTAGIDLSVGAIMVLCSVVMGVTAVDNGMSQGAAIMLALLAGVICGLVNGFLVTSLKLPPFIATLGTWNVFFGLNLWYSGSMTIMSSEISASAPMLQFFGRAVDFGRVHLTIGTFLMFALFGVLWYALNETAWGRHVHAIGDDPEAARLAGIGVEGVLLSVYLVAGVICAIGGWVLIGRIGSVTPQEGLTSNLDSITAVVVGGTSLFGGRGSLLGTLVGALIVGVYRNGLALSGVDPLWQNVAIGILIILAVTIDQWIRKITA
jgi:fructose transport system permease protein